ncbi:hypothetical protein ANN_11287 [Periplaneta americana]|uniref:Transposase Tc1-like domain-containing protein n=1 Tax=Periplaneta americana TaxID=6978 RepID=A0ABQ8T4M0_PERAM|nr:hypothetical protein ANN_11287 [Periplaneta americana]
MKTQRPGHYHSTGVIHEAAKSQVKQLKPDYFKIFYTVVLEFIGSGGIVDFLFFRIYFFRLFLIRFETHNGIRCSKTFKETQEYISKRGSCRPRCRTQNEDRSMVLSVLRERNLPAMMVAQPFVDMHGRPISAKTVRKSLKVSGLKSAKHATGPRLLRMHRVERLRFAQGHRVWRNEQWSCVLFTDESRFNLRSPEDVKEFGEVEGNEFRNAVFPRGRHLEMVE